MQLAVAYRGRSEVTRSAKSLAVSLAPNLRRDKVGFVGILRDPVRFREAVCALHEAPARRERLRRLNALVGREKALVLRDCLSGGALLRRLHLADTLSLARATPSLTTHGLICGTPQWA